VEALFSQKRKKIKNSLSAFIEKKTKLDKSTIRDIIGEIEVKDQRIETLSPEQIGELSDFVFNLHQNAPH
jgi:16S rRNA A1518/A1519 N6-dimethyltransferase RsmA/KsgA/DIM1 with predicted DNA glycosylase/AP lyase activity